MDRTVTLIVSRCVQDRIYGDRIVDARYSSVEEAQMVGNQFRSMGMSVLVRPNYNETNEKGKRYFREWRSFNGEAFREVRFDDIF